MKRAVKWHLIAQTDRQELVLLKFTESQKQSELNWKHAKEFEYQEQMYDIVETATKGDTTFYWCWWDHEETKLNKQLIQLVDLAWGNYPRNQDQNKRLIQFFKSIYFSETKTALKFYLQTKLAKPEFKDKSYKFLMGAPLVPPPESFA
ncbi:MAG: hypothetical protein Q8K70_07685 [Bacteroidota bacterium]|nr:hypothetical protein [Bacteroidota bacterium]